MSKKKNKKEKKNYFTSKNMKSLLIPFLLSAVFYIVGSSTDNDLLVMTVLVISFIVLLIQVRNNKASFSHTIYTLIGFLVLNIIIGEILNYISFEYLDYYIFFNIVYAVLYFFIYSIEFAIKQKKYWILAIIPIVSFIVMYLAMVYIDSHYSPPVAYKPIIYVYPQENIDVEVKVSNPERFTVTYPKYEEGWKLKALTDGTLIDSNNKKYYALYWEGTYDKENSIKEDGFVVKGKDSASFLEEKLEILGLNYKEANEFIMYWLPKLESNKYNYIRFQTMDEINSNMELDINPEPDTLIRVMMEYKGLDKKIEVKEQSLTKVERFGYTVVEWGGTEIK